MMSRSTSTPGSFNGNGFRPGRPCISSTSGFTLMELLVTVAIILILMTLLFPVVGKVKQQTMRTSARHDVKQLETAFRAYYDEYKRWPTGLTSYDTGSDIEDTTTGIQVESGVVAMLSGEDEPVGMNPKLVRFFEVPSERLSSGDFVDPWGNPYKYMLDYNHNDKVHIWFTSNSWETNLMRYAAVWSRGEDGSDESTDGQNEDDVVSW